MLFADKVEEAKPKTEFRGRLEAPTGTVVVADGRAMAEVRRRAEQVVKSFGGQVLDSQASNSSRESLPLANIAEFKDLLTHPVVLSITKKPEPAGRLQLGPDQAKTGPADWPTTVLEIVVRRAP